MSQQTSIMCRILMVCGLLALFAESGQAQRRENNPTEPENLLDDLRPPPDALFPYGIPDAWFDWKDEIYDKYGLRFGFSYQILGQYATDSLAGANYDVALGHWFGFLTKWTLLNRGSDNEGTLVFSMFERNTVGGNQNPALFGSSDLGSLTSNVEFTSWDMEVENFYWEQWLRFGEDKLMLRLGNQVVTTLLNPFRFKDSRSSFTTGPWAFHESIPYPTFGFGTGFKWWPNVEEASGFYIAGSLNDMNGDPNLQGLNWSTVDRHEFFYGLEVGYNWQRSKEDFDHVHLLVFYASERSTRFPDALPNEDGWGFQVLVEKQWDPWVAFSSYTYNTAEGGGVGGSVSKHTLTAGAAYLHPFNVQGEAAISFLYLNPMDGLFEDPVRDQYGLEFYWRMRLSNNIWVTPGVHLIFDPARNMEDDFIAIPSLKCRVAF